LPPNSAIDLLIRNGNFTEAQEALEVLQREANDFASITGRA